MRSVIAKSILLFSTAMFVSAQAAQTIVDFEGIPSWGTIEDFVYGGISGWNNAGSLSNHSGLTPPVLGENYFSSFPSGGELHFDLAPVIFEGMYYKSLFDSNSQVIYDLYYQNQLVYSAPFDPVNEPQDIYWLASGYSGLVDKIYFYGTSDGVIIDNLTYSTTTVPVPGAIWLFGSGLAGLMLRASQKSIR